MVNGLKTEVKCLPSKEGRDVGHSSLAWFAACKFYRLEVNRLKLGSSACQVKEGRDGYCSSLAWFAACHFIDLKSMDTFSHVHSANAILSLCFSLSPSHSRSDPSL